MTARQLACLYAHCLVPRGVHCPKLQFFVHQTMHGQACLPPRAAMQPHASKCAKLSRQTGLRPLGRCLAKQHNTPIWQHNPGCRPHCWACAMIPWGPCFGAFVSLSVHSLGHCLLLPTCRPAADADKLASIEEAGEADRQLQQPKWWQRSVWSLPHVCITAAVGRHYVALSRDASGQGYV